MRSAMTEARESGVILPEGKGIESGFVSLLSHVLGSANRFLIEQMRQHGIDNLVPSHGDILLGLFSMEPTTMQELARTIHRDPSTVTALVRKLIRSGYVTTRRSDADQRVTLVMLTDAGRALRTDFDAISASLLATQMHGVDPEGFQTTCETLVRIQENFAGALAQADASRSCKKERKEPTP